MKENNFNERKKQSKDLIKKLFDRKNIPIFIISACYIDGIENWGISGFNDLFEKERKKDILKLVRNWAEQEMPQEMPKDISLYKETDTTLTN